MSGRVLSFDGSEHAAADVLLPFYANGTLHGEELAFVEQHVRACEQCQREVDWLRAVYGALAASPSLQDATRTVPAHLTELVNRGLRPNWRGRIRAGWQTAHPWTRWLMAAQLAAIAVLGTLVATDTREVPSYRTLGLPSPSAQMSDAVAVMFNPGITESDLRRLLLGVGARIVDGPSSTEVYVLEIPAERAVEALRALRAEPLVRLAERLGPGTSR
jgi:anti-sigma factor RsiW